MIPKIIHFTWLGSTQKLPLLVECEHSWCRLHPLWLKYYWTDSNYIHLLKDLNWEPTGNIMEDKQLCQLAALHTYGGVSVDSDTFCIRPIDDLLENDFILAKTKVDQIGEHVIGWRSHDEQIKIIHNDFMNSKPHPTKGRQLYLNQYELPAFDMDYFMPHGQNDSNLYKVTKNTRCIHLWRGKPYNMNKLCSLMYI